MDGKKPDAGPADQNRPFLYQNLKLNRLRLPLRYKRERWYARSWRHTSPPARAERSRARRWQRIGR